MDDADIDRFKELTAYGLIQVLQTEEGIPVIYIPVLDQYFSITDDFISEV